MAHADKERERKYQSEWQKRNRDKTTRYVNNWRAKNPDKAKAIADRANERTAAARRATQRVKDARVEGIGLQELLATGLRAEDFLP